MVIYTLYTYAEFEICTYRIGLVIRYISFHSIRGKVGAWPNWSACSAQQYCHQIW